MMIDTQKIRFNLLYQREKCGLTQEEVAKALNVSRRKVVEWEKEPGKVKASTYADLAKLYLCNIADFFNGAQYD